MWELNLLRVDALLLLPPYLLLGCARFMIGGHIAIATPRYTPVSLRHYSLLE